VSSFCITPYCKVFNIKIYQTKRTNNDNKKVWRYHQKAVIRNRQSKNRQYNGQQAKDKKTNNDLQKSTQKTRNWATRSECTYYEIQAVIVQSINSCWRLRYGWTQQYTRYHDVLSVKSSLACINNNTSKEIREFNFVMWLLLKQKMAVRPCSRQNFWNVRIV